jgi:hypothetical protein
VFFNSFLELHFRNVCFDIAQFVYILFTLMCFDRNFTALTLLFTNQTPKKADVKGVAINILEE